MARDDIPVTPAIRFLRAKGIPFRAFTYPWEEHGGTRQSALSLGVEEHSVVKTLVLREEGGKLLLLLMHGDREASLKGLARALGVKHVEMAAEDEAGRKTGYQFGGTSPFGTRSPLAVLAERSIFSLPKILINGGKRGLLVEIDPADLRRAFPLTEVDAAVPGED
jgi:Cys-tRNA(Pro) deacylase